MSSPSRRSARPRAGFSLMEVGLILGIIALLAAGVLISSGFVNASKVAGTVHMVNSVQLAAREYVRRNNRGLSFANITNETLAEENLLPPDIVSSYNTPVTIGTLPEGSKVPDALLIKFSVPEKAECATLLPTLQEMGILHSGTCSNCPCEIQIRTR